MIMSVWTKRFWAAGRLPGNVRTAFEGDSVAELDAEARRLELGWWAVYRNDPHFHSTAQREYLVHHHDDPYWLAQGVPSEN